MSACPQVRRQPALKRKENAASSGHDQMLSATELPVKVCRCPDTSDRRQLLHHSFFGRGIPLFVIGCLLLGGCRLQQNDSLPSIEFSSVPRAEKGGTPKKETIEGRVAGARPAQRIVLFARSGAWYVQPFADQQFTKIQPDATWKNSTHLGTEYAALLVEPEYRPPTVIDLLPEPGGGVIAVAVVDGEPVFWQKWWFRLLAVLACAFALLAYYRFQLRQLTKLMNERFEERLGERMRIAQDLHDTLLQNFISASMQLGVAVDNMPEDSPARKPLGHIQQLMGKAIEEGQNTVRGLRSNGCASLDLKEAFFRLRQDLAIEEEVDFRVTVQGRPRPLHPIIRDEVYRIGREALTNGLRHSRAKSVAVEIKYALNHLCIVVRDDGEELDSQKQQENQAGNLNLSEMSERAARIKAKLKVRNRFPKGTEIELFVPANVAYQKQVPGRPLGWLTRQYARGARESKLQPPGGEKDQ